MIPSRPPLNRGGLNHGFLPPQGRWGCSITARGHWSAFRASGSGRAGATRRCPLPCPRAALQWRLTAVAGPALCQARGGVRSCTASGSTQTTPTESSALARWRPVAPTTIRPSRRTGLPAFSCVGRTAWQAWAYAEGRLARVGSGGRPSQQTRSCDGTSTGCGERPRRPRVVLEVAHGADAGTVETQVLDIMGATSPTPAHSRRASRSGRRTVAGRLGCSRRLRRCRGRRRQPARSG
jgi:hypothetical protein